MSDAIATTGERSDRLYSPGLSSKLSACGFAIAIIVGVGGLVTTAIGCAGYLGAISNLNQVHAMIMVVSGGGGGAIFLITGLVGTVKRQQCSQKDRAAIEEITFVDSKDVKKWNIDSSKLQKSFSYSTGTVREGVIHAYNEGTYFSDPPVIGVSSLVPNAEKMVPHLMLDKRKSGGITKMEGFFKSFVAPYVPILMTGDWVQGINHNYNRFDEFSNGLVRRVLLNSITPFDFRDGNVMLKIIEITDQPCEGKQHDQIEILPTRSRAKKSEREAYDQKLKQHIIDYLTRNHRRPSLSEIHKDYIIDGTRQLVRFLQDKLCYNKFDVENYYAKLHRHVISLEIWFNAYVEQLHVQFNSLEACNSGSYVFIMDSENCFAHHLSDGIDMKGIKFVEALLQVMAFAKLRKENSNFAPNFRYVGVNVKEYLHNTVLTHWQKLLQPFPNDGGEQYWEMCSKEVFFDRKGESSYYYSGPKNTTLVINQNGSAFDFDYMDLPRKKALSMSSQLGYHSDIAVALNPARKDFFDSVMLVPSLHAKP